MQPNQLVRLGRLTETCCKASKIGGSSASLLLSSSHSGMLSCHLQDALKLNLRISLFKNRQQQSGFIDFESHR